MTQINEIMLFRILFIVQLLLSELLFTYKLKKRKHFAIKYTLCTIALLLIAAFLPLPTTTSLYLILVFVILILLTLVANLFLFDVSLLNILFYVVAGYIVQFIAYSLSNCILVVSGLAKDVFGVYTEEVLEQTSFTMNKVFGYIVSFGVYSLVYHAMFLVFGSKIQKWEEIKFNNLMLFVFSIMASVLGVVVNGIFVFSKLDSLFVIMFSVYSVVSSFLILLLMFNMVKTKKTESELMIIKDMLSKTKSNYELSQKNMELINIKCHDMKHQIRELGQKKEISNQVIEEMSDIISIYDAGVETMNPILDNILTEKSLYCYKNKVKLTCIVDGRLLDFISETDMYGLFGNLLDNASHAARKIEDLNKRYIGLSVKKNKQFVTINMHNYYVGEIVFDKDGLPKTTKKDTDNHGFGIKSVAYIVEKYNGTFSITAHDNIFNINIVFPIVSA